MNNVASAQLKRLAKLLEQHFPLITDEFSADHSYLPDWAKSRADHAFELQVSDHYSDIKISGYMESQQRIGFPDLVIPENIEKQKISAQKYGAALRFFLDRYKNEYSNSYIDDICAEVCIQRTHLYKILKGERRPSRDLATAFCFVFKLNVRESQKLMLHLGERLNREIRRDYILLFGLRNQCNLDHINEILMHYNERPLTEWV